MIPLKFLDCGRRFQAITFAAFLLWLPTSRAIDSTEVKRLFRDPPRTYSTGPLWVWNDMLTEQQVRDTMSDLARQNVKQVFVHPRPGLMTPYLSADWFRLWKTALRQARKLDLNVWIYDENSYPSGFAGGWVPDQMPEARGRGLFLRDVSGVPTWNGEVMAVFRIDGMHSENITPQAKLGLTLPTGRYVIASVQRAANSPWHGNRSYVDLMYPRVTEKFLEITLEAYRREVGGEFGRRIPGVFTDEPNIRPAGGLPWTEDLPQQFHARRGYALIDHLASLILPVGDWRKIRHDYYQTLNELFIERWAQPYHNYCAEHQLEMTGHYWDHEWPHCGAVPDNMAMYAWEQRPAIDCLMNQFQEHTHAQFGNLRMVKELSSVANQLGLHRTLCEVYGAGGWDLRFEDMKRIGDWLEVLGVNTLDQHLSYVTIRGARKRDHPQSFSYHEPWWPAYHVSAEYLARLSAALAQGSQINSVLVLEPTTTAWMIQGDEPALDKLGSSFFTLLQSLEAAQVEYDLGCEDVIARQGAVEGNQLKIGQRKYDTVVLPPHAENLNGPTLRLLEPFIKNGGRLLCAGATPQRIDGTLSPAAATLARFQNWRQIEPSSLAATLRSQATATGFSIARDADDGGILFHHRRQIEDGEIVLLVNSSIDHSSSGTIETANPGIEKWNLENGRPDPYPFEPRSSGAGARFSLPPCGSLLLFLSHAPLQPAADTAEQRQRIPASNPIHVRQLDPNVLTLDYVDVSAGSESRTNLYFYQAQQFVFQKNGLSRNPWDSAVQFKNELIRQEFPAGSGFSATYRFVIEGSVPKSLAIVIERTDLYTITCNGRRVTAQKGQWWLDKAFGKIDLSSQAHPGENQVTITASPMTIYHELEPAYLLGDFNLTAASRGFVVTPLQPLELGKWNGQGRPFYSGRVGYQQEITIPNTQGKFMVSMPHWYGSVAEVRLNGTTAGWISAAPWQCEVTRHLKRGANQIEVIVIGTLKNTLGPHHGNPSLGAAWPGMFQRGPNSGPPPGNSYSTVGYGLFEPFELWQICPKPTQTTMLRP